MIVRMNMFKQYAHATMLRRFKTRVVGLAEPESLKKSE